jgi:hypothetical protein
MGFSAPAPKILPLNDGRFEPLLEARERDLQSNRLAIMGRRHYWVNLDRLQKFRAAQVLARALVDWDEEEQTLNALDLFADDFDMGQVDGP